ncbi:MAG: polysaccharide biosynthesis/export family protein [Planctomycetaceae bacterium]|nr:polysaccharide biosynthesis/export family protein [Planctomycetaceae bacterium]
MILRYGSIALAAAVVIVVGCQTHTPPASSPLPLEFLQDKYPAQEVPVAHVMRRDYRLREGDQLEIIYHVRHNRTPSYKIKIEDEISIRFPFNPNMNQTERVNSDGTLQLLLVGTVNVYNKTIQELQDELVKLYSKYIRNPVLTVSFLESNKKIQELRIAITTAPRGQSRLVPITPEGSISLPFVSNIGAAGKTVGELHTDLNSAYKDVGLEELEVTVNIQAVAPTRIYVLGEVKIPGTLLNKTGAIETNQELSLLQALSQAGSYIPPRADLSKVMVIRRRHLPRPQAAIVNVYQLLENRKRPDAGAVQVDCRKYRYDMWLEDGDIVYVPTTDIAKRADYIEYVWQRGIRNIGGFSSNVSANYTVGDTVDWLK